MDLRETFKELQSELSKISVRHDDVIEKQREIYLDYHRHISEREELLAIGEDEKAKSLDSKIKTLRSQVDKFEREIKDLSPERIREVVKKHSDSKLHQMALSIQTEGLKQMEALQKEITQVSTDVEEAKEAYLKAVENAGNAHRSLFDVYLAVRKAEEMLPEKKANKPQNIPNWDDFEIGEKELSKAYGRRPFLG